MASQKEFVLDGSVTMAWYCKDEMDDYAYLELAMRRGLSLATLDDKLKAAAAAGGVSLFTAS